MSTSQEQYADSLKKSQEAVLDAMQAWTKNAQSAFSTSMPSVSAQLRPEQVIDQVFDFAEQMLAVQRQFAKSLAAAAAKGTPTP